MSDASDQKRPFRKRRVLLIDLGAHFGGVENYLVSLAHLLKADVDLYALCVLPELAKRLQDAGVKTTLLPTLSGGLKPVRFVVAALLLPILLLRDHIDIVQVNGFLEATLMLPTRVLGRKTVYTRHGPFEMELFRWYRDPLRFIPRFLARISVHLATQVVCVSETVGLGVRRIKPAVPTVVIPNWLAGQPEPRHGRRDATGPVTIVCASRLEQYKGIQLAILAVRDLPEVKLVVVGDGPYRTALENLAAEQIALGTVEFAGFQREMQPYYELADLFIMPSLGPEGLPMSSLEAMGRGLPCILSDLPVHKEITNAGIGAMLFTSGDVPALRSAIMTMVRDQAVWERFSAEGYRIVGERYTAQRVRASYIKVFAGG